MYERMLDKERQPDQLAMAEYCYPMSDSFNEFNNFLRNHFGTTQELRFPYGNQYGWSVCHRKGKQLICDVFAEKGAFTVMVRLPEEQLALLQPQMSEASQSFFDQAFPCGNGAWIHYRLSDPQYLPELKLIFNTKMK